MSASTSPVDEAELAHRLATSLEVYGATGYQVAVLHGGEAVINIAGGVDFSGRPVTPATSSAAYCLAKPLLAAAVACQHDADEVLATPLGALTLGLDPSLDEVTCWQLLDHRAHLDPVPMELLLMAPAELRWDLTRALTRRRPPTTTHGARYQDLTPWIVSDHVLRSAGLPGLLEHLATALDALGLDDITVITGAPGCPLPAVATDGSTLPRRRSYACLVHHDYVTDRSMLLSVQAPAVELARAYWWVAHLITGDAVVRSRLVPPPDRCAVDHDLEQAFGAGTMLDLNAHGMGDAGRGLVGHLAWAGTGMAWWDPAANQTGVVRLVGLDHSDDAFRYRLRPILRWIRGSS